MSDPAANHTADRQAIVDLIVRYARGADAGRFDEVIACFADDARLESAAGVREGVAAIRASFAPAALAEARRATSGMAFDRSSHMMGNILVTIDGDRAHAESAALLHLLRRAGDGDLMVVRSVRYSDDFVRTPAGWRISRRVHALDWQGGPFMGEPTP